MIDLFKLYDLFCATVNVAQNGHVRPVRNFIAWINEINLELFNELGSKWERNRAVTDLLRPFIITVNVSLVKESGAAYDIAQYPNDYGGYSSARRIVKVDNSKSCACRGLPVLDGETGKCSTWNDEDDIAKQAAAESDSVREFPISKVDNQRWGSVMSHRLLAPRPDKPYMTQFDGGFKVAPRGTGIIILDYLRLPKAAVFAYTVVDDQVVYDPSGSEQLEWPDTALPTIIARLKKRYGTFTGQDNVYSQGEMERRETGQ